MDEMRRAGQISAELLNASAGFLISPFDLPGVAVLISAGRGIAAVWKPAPSVPALALPYAPSDIYWRREPRGAPMHAAKLARAALIAAFAFVTVAPAAAQNILGFDDMSCAAWRQSNGDPDQRAAYVNWSRGFLTGHNYALPKQQVSTISSGTVENYIDRYCTSNPTGQFSDGVMRLSDQFSGRNQPIRK